LEESERDNINVSVLLKNRRKVNSHKAKNNFNHFSHEENSGHFQGAQQ